MALDPSIAEKKATASANFQVTRKDFQRALTLLSETWSGYRHHVAAKDYQAAFDYVADMPDTSSKAFALFHIKGAQKEDVIGTHNETEEIIEPLPNIEVLTKRKSVAVADFESSRARHFAVLDELVDAWSGVQPIIEQKEYEKAHEYLNDMPDSSAKMFLTSRIFDAQEAVPPAPSALKMRM